MKVLMFSFLFTACAALVPAAENPAVAGQWKVHSNISGYESDMDCTFTQKDKEIAGTCKSDQDPVTITGKVEEKKVTFQFKTQYQGEDLTIIYTGTIESNKMAGTVDVQPMAVSGDFTAAQAK
jgi:hypothetical protein